jgi:membrane-anchored protein YejM (alkaline phosphatase superfamily)
MNSLQKLIDVEDYESFITMDPILSLIVRPSTSISELDKGRDWVDYDLCHSLEEIRTRMDDRQESAKPLFVYTQAQNLHIVMRNHRMRTTHSDEHPGFDAFYSTQLGRIDACFGQFVEYLKSRNLYDNSIVILTSDHGDDLGEGGRWGHGYWLYPELIRIPFIIHLPQRIRQGLVWDTKDVAFPTDITPSLYYLLGHRPIIRNELFGRPLFTVTRAERSEYLQDSYLLGSSYGANYGLLTQNGQKLFLSESKNQKDYLFDFSNGPNGKLCPMTPAFQSEQRGLIREHIRAISRFYKLNDDR